MLIGISGKIGSGKDTVGSIIQYLTSRVNGNNLLAKDKPLSYIMNYDEYIKGFRTHNYVETNWEIKKYAFKLKQIVALITGCSVNDLESQEFKAKQLGEEWNISHKNWIWKNELRRYAELANIPFEEYIKREHVLLAEEKGQKIYRSTFLDKKYTYRELLQKIGTEAMRDTIHNNIWINALFADYKPKYWNIKKERYQEIGNFTYYQSGIDKNAEPVVEHFPNWIITDMRFPNELKAIEDRNGITIRVNRDYIVKGDTNTSMKIGNPEPFNHHPSETALDNANFKYTINNDGSIEELIEKVKEILILEKII